MKKVILNFEQVLELTKTFKKMHESEDMNDYEHGIVDGIEFMLFLYGVCEK